MAIAGTPEGMIPCPSCGRVTTVETGYCTHCGAPLFTLTKEAPSYEWDLYLGTAPDGSRMGISGRDLTKHMTVFGNVGSGKTTMVKRLLFEASKAGIGFLVLDWSGEYRDLARVTGARHLQGHGSPDPLRISLFDPRGMDQRVYAANITSILVRAMQDSGWQLTPQMESVLGKVVREAVRRRAPVSGLPGIIEEAAQGVPQGRMTAAALEARLHHIIHGLSSGVYQGPDSPERFLGGRTIVDLSWLSSISPREAWMLGQVLLNKFHAEAARAPITGTLRHILVVEEAEELAPSRCGGAGYTGLASMMVQLRRRGVGVVIVAHSPQLLDPGVARIPGNVAVFRISHVEDARAAAGSLGGLGLEAEVQSLGVGELLLRPSSSPVHYRVRVDPVEGAVWDDESKVLDSVMKYPHLTQRERRELLKMSSSRYSRAVSRLLEAGIVEMVTVNTGRGRPVKLLQVKGQNPGAAHRFLEHRAASILASLGIEASHPGSGGPDLVAPVGGGVLCVEVETGTNVNTGKYIRFSRICDTLIIVCASRKCMSRARSALAAVEGLAGRARVVLLSGLKRAARSAGPLTGGNNS